MISAVSCVNEEYARLTEDDVDMTMTVLKNVSLPVGSLEKVILSDILEKSGGTSFFDIDDDGDIAIRFADDANVLSQEVTVPEFSFKDSYEVFNSENTVGEIPFFYDEKMSEHLDVLETPREFPDLKMVVEFHNSDIPSQIKDIRYIKVQALASLNISVRIDQELPFTAHIPVGARIVFPEWIVLGEVGDAMEINGNVVTLTEEIKIPVSTPENVNPESFINIPVVAVDMTKLPADQGILSDRSFYIRDEMTLKGSVYFTYDSTESVGITVLSPVISTVIKFTDFDIISADIMLSDEVEGDIVTGLAPISLEGMPDYIMDKGLVLDVDDVRLDVDFSNLSPFSGNISAAVATSLSGETLADIKVGPVRFEAGTDNAPAEMHWSFSEGHLETPSGYTLYKVVGLTDLLKQMPDLIEFKDFELNLDDEYVTVGFGQTYKLQQSYSIYAPLAFGPDFQMPYTYEIPDLDLVFEDVCVPSIVLEIDVENSIPMDFSAEVQILDENGVYADDISFSIKDNAILKAGTHQSPTMNHLTFVLENGRDQIQIHGLVVKFLAAAPSVEYQGIPLNVNQGLHFKNIVLNLPEGITADLDEM
ncbi:MAG: hypothetical protein IKU36_04585 [Bacteroidales bacterium]|nr:hypothetical protein [Bacteroidales bacterium]